MSEWNVVALEEVLAPVRRKVVVADLDEVPWAGARWYAGGIYARTIEVASNVKTKTLDRLEVNDITYNRMWATKAAFGVVANSAAGCLVTGDFPIFVADRERLEPAFMRAVFQTQGFQDDASARAVGTTERRRLKESDFLRMRIALPTLSEQRRIIDVLAALDGKIEALDGEVDAAHQFCSAQRTELLRTPDGQAKTALGEVLKVHHGWAFPSSGCRQPIGDGTPRLIRIGDFARSRRSHFDPDRPEEFVGRFPDRYILTAGTLLVVMTCQTPDGAILGWPMRVPTGGPYLHNQRIGRVEITDEDRIETRYARQLFQSIELNDALSATAGGTKVLHTSPTKIHDVAVFLPTLGEQKQIADVLEAIDENVRRCESELASLRSFRSAVLSALLGQEMEISESYDTLIEKVT